MKPAPLANDPLVRSIELRRMLGGISKMTEWRWRKAGILPEPIKIRRHCFYRQSVVDGLMEQFDTGEKAA